MSLPFDSFFLWSRISKLLIPICSDKKLGYVLKRCCCGVSMFRNSASFYAPLRVGTVRSAENRGGVQKVVHASQLSQVCTPVSRDSLLRWVGLRRRSVAEHAHLRSRSFLLNVKCKKQDRKLGSQGSFCECRTSK